MVSHRPVGVKRYVIGSGPAGIMCAKALLDAGHEIVVIDVGRELPEKPARIAEDLAGKEIDRWTETDVEKARGSTVMSSSGIPKRLTFGSDFAYADDVNIRQEGSRCVVSHAKGGFSTIWGGSVLPNRTEDFETWPVTLKEMIPHYKAVGETMGIAASAEDPLTDWFPHYAEPLPPAKRSAQADYVFERSRRHASRLASRGIRVGGSRLALQTRPDSKDRCRNAGLCLTGCPFSAVYSTAKTLEELKRNEKFQYLDGYRVRRLEERGETVAIIATRTDDGREEVFVAERAYVGCGALATAMIVAASLPGEVLSMSMTYQPYFMIPFVLLKNFPDVAAERLHTLNQLNIEVSDEGLSPHPLHLQLYTFNHFVSERLERIFRFFSPLRRQLRRFLLGRVVTAQAYAHADASTPIRVEFRKTPDGNLETSLTGAPDQSRLSSLASRTIRKLAKSSRELGMVPVPFMRILGTPGDGSHVGSIFPMRARPEALETDRLGCLPGHPRIHLIDGSVLTTIPAATITYTIMANAHRIGSETAER